jgi:hypothetical protein
MRLLVCGNSRKVAKLAERYHDVLGRLLVPAAGNGESTVQHLGLPWAGDNGAYSGFDEQRYLRFLKRIAGRAGCLFVTVPDVVCNASATLATFDLWEQTVRSLSRQPLALVAQNGMEDLVVPWGRFDALFLGGDDRWKESRAAWSLAQEARSRGKHLHAGRVNSRRRMLMARKWGCDSIDGSGMSKFGDVHLGRLLRWRREIEGLMRERELPYT